MPRERFARQRGGAIGDIKNTDNQIFIETKISQFDCIYTFRQPLLYCCLTDLIKLYSFTNLLMAFPFSVFTFIKYVPVSKLETSMVCVALGTTITNLPTRL